MTNLTSQHPNVCPPYVHPNVCPNRHPPVAASPLTTTDSRSSATSCRLSSRPPLIEAGKGRSATMTALTCQESPVTEEELTTFSADWFHSTQFLPSSETCGLVSLDAEGAAEQLMEELHFPDLLFGITPSSWMLAWAARRGPRRLTSPSLPRR